MSPDGGLSWQPTGLFGGMVLSLATDFTGALYAGTSFAGGQVSLDQGITWIDLDPGLGGAECVAYALAIDPKDHEKVFVGGNETGPLVSRDGGATWAVAGLGYTSREV